MQTDEQLKLDVGTVDGPGLYRDMVLSRRVDTEAIALQRQGELGLWPSLLGQEAAQVGASRGTARRPDCWVWFESLAEQSTRRGKASDRAQI